MSLVFCSVFLFDYCSNPTHGWLNNRIVNITNLDYTESTLTYIFFLSFIPSRTQPWWKLLRHFHTPHVMTSPCNKVCLPPEGLPVPPNLFANTYSRDHWICLVMSHNVFYHLQLGFENNQMLISPLCSSPDWFQMGKSTAHWTNDEERRHVIACAYGCQS